MRPKEREETRITIARIIDIPPDDITIRQIGISDCFTLPYFEDDKASIGITFEDKPSLEELIDKIAFFEESINKIREVEGEEEIEDIDKLFKEFFDLLEEDEESPPPF